MNQDINQQVRNTEEKKKKERKKMKGWVKACIAVILVITIITGVVFGGLFLLAGRVNTEKRGTESYDDTVSFEPEDVPKGYEVLDDYEIINADGVPIMSNKDITNILLIGCDSNSTDKSGSRSDTMILLSLDNKNKKIKMTSLLRDLYVTIPGRGNDRLNHSYAYGGADLLIRTIEYNFRVKIDKYVKVNFDTFSKIIDRIGGVDIQLTQAEANIVGGGAKTGMNHLNGTQTRTYSRIRKLDSDFGRTNRQRTVIDAVIKDLKKQDIGTLTSIMYDVLPMVTTDYTSAQLVSLILQAPKISGYENVETHFPRNDNYRGVYIRGMAVLVTDMETAALELQEFIYE